MFERSIEKELERWANDTYRKPLVLRGARQVGKTTIVNHIGQSYIVTGRKSSIHGITSLFIR